MSSVTTTLVLSAGDLAKKIGGSFAFDSDARLDMPGTKTITVESVDEPTLRAAIAAAAAAFEQREAKRGQVDARFRQAVPTLRQWSQDAANANTNWPTLTQAQKDNALRLAVMRLGIFFDHFADLLQTTILDD